MCVRALIRRIIGDRKGIGSILVSVIARWVGTLPLTLLVASFMRIVEWLMGGWMVGWDVLNAASVVVALVTVVAAAVAAVAAVVVPPILPVDIIVAGVDLIVVAVVLVAWWVVVLFVLVVLVVLTGDSIREGGVSR